MSQANDPAHGLQMRSVRIQRLKQVCPGASLVLYASPQGEVLESAGPGDRDGVAAVAEVGARALARAAARLGLGRLEGLALVAEDSMCCARVGDDLDVVFIPDVEDGGEAIIDFFDYVEQTSKRRTDG